MHPGHYELVRLERELRLQSVRPHPLWSVPRLRDVRAARPRLPRRAPRPLMQAHEYLELEFAVDERR